MFESAVDERQELTATLRVAKYRRHAADCLRLAQLLNTPRDQAVLREMAAMWLRLVERAERMDQAEMSSQFPGPRPMAPVSK